MEGFVSELCGPVAHRMTKDPKPGSYPILQNFW